MIIVKLMGGLGNQMFQYAAGRALAAARNSSLKLDLSYLKREWLERLKGNPLRKYSLNVFNINEEFAQRVEIPLLAFFPGTRFSKVIRWTSQALDPRAPVILKEIPFNLSANLAAFKSAPENVYLDGYWQSEEYFKEASGLLYHEFTPRKRLSPYSQNLAEQILAVKAVSLHIRRADYVTHPVFRRFFAACSANYYLECVRYLAERFSDLHFFIFGDDLIWAKENLKINHPITYVSGNLGQKTYCEDMKLMSLCRHNIIANSSFSWWSAYLNQSPQKIVIAPKKWFKTDLNEESIIPAGWVKIPN